MTNQAIARAFYRLADLLEIQGDNPFKVRAYRKAAETIENLTENLEVIAERGELETIPSIGKGIAGKIAELCAGGQMREYERARSLTPESLLEVTALPGFGPKKALALYERLGIVDLESLEDAARHTRLRALPGFSGASEEATLRAIAAYRRRGGRWPIHRAWPYAEGLRREIAALPEIARVEPAGSIRRLKDTVGSVDFAAAALDFDAALAAFRRLEEVAEVVERGVDFVRAQSRAGILLGLFLGAPEEFGHRLRAATGSAEHNAAIAALASSRRLEIDARGVLRKDGAPLPAPEEEEVFRCLGISSIAPELREGRGEVEAAVSGTLPRLLVLEDIRGILHCHSTWSDGRVSVEEMAAAAGARGHEYIGITDHSRSLGIAHGLDEDRLRAQMAEIDALNAVAPDDFRVLRGIECDILSDGTLDLSGDLLRELDFVIGSVHSHFRQDEETITRRMIAAVESGCIDLVAHPTGRLLGGRDPYPVDVLRLIEAAAANRVALEINADPHRLDLNDLHARQASQAGVLLSLNTDAHSPAGLDLIEFGLATARRAWVEPAGVINTWPLPRLREWVASRRR